MRDCAAPKQPLFLARAPNSETKSCAAKQTAAKNLSGSDGPWHRDEAALKSLCRHR